MSPLCPIGTDVDNRTARLHVLESQVGTVQKSFYIYAHYRFPEFICKISQIAV